MLVLILLLILATLLACSQSAPLPVPNGTGSIESSSSESGSIENMTSSAENETLVVLSTNVTSSMTSLPRQVSSRTPGTEKLILTPLDRERLARQLLTDISTVYADERWGDLYTLVETNLSREEFIFFMNITSFRTKLANDPAYSYIMGVRGYRNDGGTNFSVKNLTLTPIEGVARITMTFRNAPVTHAPFLLVWSGERWILRQESILNGVTADEICSSLSYHDLCFLEYAKFSGRFEYCDKAGTLVLACYSALGEPVTATAVITACSGLATRSANDECLFEAVLFLREELLCRATVIPMNRKRCEGVLGLESCLRSINSPSPSAALFGTMCRIGAAAATKNASLCAPIRQEELRDECRLLSARSALKRR